MAKGKMGMNFQMKKGFWAGPFNTYPNTVLALENLVSKFNSMGHFDNCKFCNPEK